MTVAGHIRELTEKHRKLDHEITLENRRPNPDQSKVSEMKRQKLRLKEEIERLHQTANEENRI